MTLREKQSEFARMVCDLIRHGTHCGYEFTFGDAYRDPRVMYGHQRSLHQMRLAVDLNVFRDGEYLTDGKMFEDLGEFWEQLGGSWGERFGDGNHFSLAHRGMR